MTQPTPPVVLTYATGQIRNFVSAHRLALAIQILLATSILTGVVAIVSFLMQIRLLESAQAGVAITPSQANLNDIRVAALAFLKLALILATAILFFIWVHRTTRNLTAFSHVPLKYSPGWSVGYFFVPFLNIVRPYQILSEIWNRSLPGPMPTKAPGLVVIWWSCWMINGFIAQVASAQMQQTRTSPATLSRLISGSYTHIGGEAIMIISGICCLLIVRKINALQLSKAQTIPLDIPQTQQPALWHPSTPR